MAITEAGRLTQLDVARRTLKDGNALLLAELLFESNPLYQDLKFVEANMGTYHRYGVARGVISAENMAYNGYFGEARSDIEMAEDKPCAFIKYSKIDKLVYDSAPNGDSLRAQEDKAATEGLNQQMVNYLLYGSETLNGIKGIYNRFNPAGQTALNRFRNMWSGGKTGTGTLASILVVEHGEGKVFGIYPKGVPAGISVRDIGEEPEYEPGTAAGALPRERRVLKTEFKVANGLVWQDSRCMHRICNIDPASTTTADWDLVMQQLIKVMNYLPNGGKNAVIYTTRDVRAAMQINAAWKTNVNLDMKDPWGQPLLNFWGVPIKIIDQMVLESTVTIS